MKTAKSSTTEKKQTTINTIVLENALAPLAKTHLTSNEIRTAKH